jgi:hypothetical protein
VAFQIWSGKWRKTRSTADFTIHQCHEKPRLCSTFLLEPLIKTPVGLFKSCRGTRDLQLCYLPGTALLFKFLEFRPFKQGQSKCSGQRRAHQRSRAPRCPTCADVWRPGYHGVWAPRGSRLLRLRPPRQCAAQACLDARACAGSPSAPAAGRTPQHTMSRPDPLPRLCWPRGSVASSTSQSLPFKRPRRASPRGHISRRNAMAAAEPSYLSAHSFGRETFKTPCLGHIGAQSIPCCPAFR